jgi:hypothetical protein
MVFALQKTTIFKNGNITVHSFLNTALLYKHKDDFYNDVPITRIEDDFIMIVLIIGLTMLFNHISNGSISCFISEI